MVLLVGSLPSANTLKNKGSACQAFVPLNFDQEAMQVDWGQAAIYLKGVRTKIRLFCTRLCYSAMPFVIAFPNERLELY